MVVKLNTQLSCNVLPLKCVALAKLAKRSVDVSLSVKVLKLSIILNLLLKLCLINPRTSKGVGGGGIKQTSPKVFPT